MPRISTTRLFAVAFATVLSLALGGFAYASFAAGPLAFVYGPGNAPCERTKTSVPAGEQGTAFSIELRNFDRAEEIAITLTFPDGRIFSPDQASALSGLITPPPPGGPFIDYTTTGGDYFNSFAPTPAWPYGCYIITAQGTYSANVATAYYVVIPGSSATNPGLTTLAIEDSVTNQSSGVQGTSVNIFGRGYPGLKPLPPIYLKQPDGTILPVPLPPGDLTTDIGTFVVPFSFSTEYQVGTYRFFVLGYNGNTVDATFNLTSLSGKASGYGSARIAVPFPSDVHQGYDFEVQGKLFEKNELVTIELIAPNGAHVTLGAVPASRMGTFTATFSIDPSLPTGKYGVVASGAKSVATTSITVVSP